MKWWWKRRLSVVEVRAIWFNVSCFLCLVFYLRFAWKIFRRSWWLDWCSCNVIPSVAMYDKSQKPPTRNCCTWVPAKGLFTLFASPSKFNPFFALDIFICSFRKCIQHTTRGQSNFPLSKLCYCYIFIVLKYWWHKSITAHIYANCDWGIVNRWVIKRSKRGQKVIWGI